MKYDTKAAARWSPKCIGKTKKYVLWNADICPIAKSCEQLLPHAAELWPKTVFLNGGRPPCWIYEKLYLVIWLSPSSKCAVVYKISSNGFSLRYGDLTICDMVVSAMLNFRNLEFMSHDLYRHAILVPCAKFHWNRTIGWQLLSYGQKTIFKVAAVCHLEF